ncbi:MAG: anti-sigma factor family protein [Bacillota bacterium]
MNCKDLEGLLDPYLDGELDPAQRSLVDQHLEGCADCPRRLEGLRALHQALQSPELRYQASDTLKARLRNELLKAAAREARPKWPRWAAAAAVAVLAAGLGWFYMVPHGGDVDDTMVDAAVDQQQDAVKSGHLTDLASSDPKTVQTWFSGKLAYVPPVPDLSARGYTLAGARLDTVKGEPAAALTYKHSDDVVEVFVCAAQHGDTDLDTDNDDGYNVVYWTKGPLSFWVVSKIAPADLKQLGESLRQAT